MHYHIYCNLKTMDICRQNAIQEFEKRLSAYCSTTLHPALSLSFPKDTKEANHLFLYIRTGPSTYSSEEFADFLKDIQHSGKSYVHIIIGYSETAFYDALAPLPDSISPLTLSLTGSCLSLETITLLFYEQLYRAYTILQGKTYHK